MRDPSAAAAAPGGPHTAGDSLTDSALWEAAVQRYDPDGPDCIPPGHSPNTRQIAEGQEAMAESGAVPGTGFLYFGRGSTQKVIYRSLDGRYWDITYRRFEEDPPTYDARWRIMGAQPWYHSPFGPALPEQRETHHSAPPSEREGHFGADATVAPPPPEPAGGAGASAAEEERLPCGCSTSLLNNPFHGLMVSYGQCEQSKPP